MGDSNSGLPLAWVLAGRTMDATTDVHAPWLHVIPKIVDHQLTPDLTIWFIWPNVAVLSF